jgi:nonribosomal peptide synthetase DhbF
VCVVPEADAPTATALRRHLAEVLPPHMLPHRIRFADRLPLTPHGKLDRRALAEAVGTVG